MIAKFPGKCSICGKAITVGVDEYDYETKTNYHRGCYEEADRKLRKAQEQLAEELGYLPIHWEGP